METGVDAGQIIDKIVEEEICGRCETFQAYQLVWSRLPGYPYWPSVLLDLKTGMKTKLKNRKSAQKYEFISFWLDSGKVSYIQTKNVMEFFVHFQQIYEPKRKQNAYINAVDRSLQMAIKFHGLTMSSKDLLNSLLNKKCVVDPIVFDSMKSFQIAFGQFTSQGNCLDCTKLEPLSTKFRSKLKHSEPKFVSLSLKSVCQCCQTNFETVQNSIRFVDCTKCLTVNIGPKLSANIIVNNCNVEIEEDLLNFNARSSSSEPETRSVSSKSLSDRQTPCSSNDVDSMLQENLRDDVDKISQKDLNFNSVYSSPMPILTNNRFESFRYAKKSFSTDTFINHKNAIISLGRSNIVEKRNETSNDVLMTCSSTEFAQNFNDYPISRFETKNLHNFYECTFCGRKLDSSESLRCHEALHGLFSRK